MARLLMIVSSARSIDLISEEGRETGYSADEVLKPYDKFVAGWRGGGGRNPRRKAAAR